MQPVKRTRQDQALVFEEINDILVETIQGMEEGLLELQTKQDASGMGEGALNVHAKQEDSKVEKKK